MNIHCRTRLNNNPKGKPRVFFTCHKEDFQQLYNRVCSDIWRVCDCAVFFTEDLDEVDDYSEVASYLERMNLVVIPVTRKLLTEPNRAMDRDFSFAMQNGIPVLPILFEQNILDIYSRDDKFGKLQYMDPQEVDPTALTYEFKLKRYLDSVLITDELADKIRKAFDAYVFLSYRKKDRDFAQKLMRIIHSDPDCQDIALWYDEYLVPGERFDKSILDAMGKCKAFTLLVTPNLINENNYVQEHEYPSALDMNMPILPVEMVKVDHDILRSRYLGLPETICIGVDHFDDNEGTERADINEEMELRRRLLETLRKTAHKDNDNDPTHSFMMGLAYLEGIDVEVDRERAVSLITRAAQSELPEAMGRLAQMYHSGSGVEWDIDKYVYWTKKLVSNYEENCPPDSDAVLTGRFDLVQAYIETSRSDEALDQCRKIEEAHSSDDSINFRLYAIMGHIYRYRFEMDKAKEAFKRAETFLGSNSVSEFEMAGFYYYLGELYLEERSWYQAQESFYRSITCWENCGKKISIENARSIRKVGQSLLEHGIETKDISYVNDAGKILETAMHVLKQLSEYETVDDEVMMVNMQLERCYKAGGKEEQARKVSKELEDEIEELKAGDSQKLTHTLMHSFEFGRVKPLVKKREKPVTERDIVERQIGEMALFAAKRGIKSLFTASKKDPSKANDKVMEEFEIYRVKRNRERKDAEDYCKLGLYKKALECYKRDYEVRVKLYGENDPSVAETLRLMEEVKKKLGE